MKRLNRKLKDAIRHVGFDVSRYQARTHPVAKKFDLVRRLGIDLVLDVGANTGQFAAELRTEGYRGRIVSFEPLSSAFAGLAANSQQDPSWQAENFALGDVEGEQTINIAENSWSSSLLPVSAASTSAHPDSRRVGTEQIRVRRLDSIFPALAPAESKVWLKIDTQGFEKHVLEGAVESLPRIVMLQLEMSFVPMYDDQPLFVEMYQWATERGFRMGSMEGAHWHPQTGELLWLDGLFHRPEAL